MPEARPLRISAAWPYWGGVTAGACADQVERALEEPRAASRVAISDLVRAQLDFVWRLLRRLGQSPARADDLAQEVFLVALRRQDEIVPGRERAFLYGIAVRLAANARRQDRRRREVCDAELVHVDAGTLPDGIVEQRRELAELDALLDELPDKLRRVLVLSDVLELEVGEVAEYEGLARGTVASRLRRAREIFRKKLALYRRRTGRVPEASLG